MASRFLKQLHVPSKPLFRSSVFPNKASPFNVHLRNGTNVTFANPQALGSHLQSMRKLNSCLDWQGKANTWWNCRQIGTTPGTPLEHEELPDPLNPHEHPLATVGYEELSEDKKYWRKRQSEAPKKVYVRQVDENGYAFAIGKRKSSVARVWIREGTGSVLINGKDWVDYFPRTDHRDQIMRPLFLIGKAGLMSIECSITGGGNTGQAEALRHGVARALLKWNPDWRKSLKKDGLLTRDSRVVESKKYGRKKARKAFQWVKR